MASADDFLKIFQFAAGLTSGFGAASARERESRRAEQLQAMQLLQRQGDRFVQVPDTDVEPPRGLFARSFGVPPTSRATGAPLFQVGQSSFAPAPPERFPSLSESLGAMFPGGAPAAQAGASAAPVVTDEVQAQQTVDALRQEPRFQTGLVTPPAPAARRVGASVGAGGVLTSDEVLNDPVIRVLLQQTPRTVQERDNALLAVANRIEELKTTRVKQRREQSQAARPLTTDIVKAFRLSPPTPELRAQFEAARQANDVEGLQDVLAQIPDEQGSQRGATEANFALQAAKGDPLKALALMRKQRTASQAVTNISLGEKKEAQKAQQQVTANIVTQDIARVLGVMEIAELPTTGAVGSFLTRVPGTAASNVKFLLDSVKANVGFERLNQMRLASPTGGALGQVTERELGFLQATLGSLDQAQTQDQFIFNLKRIHDQFLDTVHGAGNGPTRLLQPVTIPGTSQTATPGQATLTVQGKTILRSQLTPAHVDQMTPDELNAYLGAQ